MNFSTSHNTECVQNKSNFLLFKSIGKFLVLFLIFCSLLPGVYAQTCNSLAASSTHINVSCYGTASGSINLAVTGGTSPYAYAWVAATGGIIPAGQATNQNLTGLVAGTYRVAVTDANGCSVIETVVITQAAQPLAASYVQVNPGCDSIGIVNLTPFGGVTPYSYAWTATNGGVVPAGQQHGQDMYNVIPGTYTVLLTDFTGCSITITAVLTQSSAPLVATSTQTNVGCSGAPTGTIDLTVTGGKLPYTYSWTSSNGGIIPAGQSTGEDLSGLSAGIYSVLVTSSNGGCVTTKNILITTGKLNITYTQINQTCGASGSIHVNVNGGSPGYTYSWAATNGGVVPAGEAINKDLDHLVAGTYTLTVTDTIGCTGTITVIITQSGSGISITATPTNVQCFGELNGAINLTVNGGSGQYTYQWFAFFGGHIPAGQANNQNLSGLTAGVYTVFITDGYCSGHKTVVITQPLPLIVTGFVSNLHSCAASDAAINLIVVGGTSPYTYAWTASNGAVIPAGQANNQNLTGLTEGSYTVVVTTSHGCTSTKTFEVNCPHPVFGCGHGFWKNHTEYWNNASTYTVVHMPAGLRFTSSTNFNAYFNIAPGTAGLPNNLTMLNAVKLQGGQCKGFARDAVTALLDIASGQNVPFPAGTTDFTSLYHAIRTAMLASDCDGALRSGLKAIVESCHDDDNEGEHDDKNNRIVESGSNLMTLSAYPNPINSFTDKITFKIRPSVSGQATLELYDIMGTKLAVVFNGYLDMNTDKIIVYKIPANNKRTLIYRFRINDKTSSGKVILLN
ncbi:hypothetical protein BH11BAC4_BH11BAC4_18790 [soil metagenome]